VSPGRSRRASTGRTGSRFSRTRRRPPASLWGRLARGLLAGLLLLVVGLFAASHLGLIDVSQVMPDRAARITPAVTWELTPTDLLRSLSGHHESAPEYQAGRFTHEDPAGGPARVVGEIGSSEAPIRVFLTNGCGVNRLAAGYRSHLRDAGFDVFGVSNADREDYATTLVIDRSGKAGAAEQVCAFMQETFGVGRLLLQTRAVSPEGDVLIILGDDAARALPEGD
jgi:hypothetical protein